MHFLHSSSVCVLLPIDTFFGCARIKLYINGIASYRIAYKKYIDISYKLDILPSPSEERWHWLSTSEGQIKYYVSCFNFFSLCEDCNIEDRNMSLNVVSSFFVHKRLINIKMKYPFVKLWCTVKNTVSWSKPLSINNIISTAIYEHYFIIWHF